MTRNASDTKSREHQPAGNTELDSAAAGRGFFETVSGGTTLSKGADIVGSGGGGSGGGGGGA